MPTTNGDDEEVFAIANRAYERLTLADRTRVLETFMRLTGERRGVSLADRWSEAVHRVVANEETQRSVSHGPD